MNAAVDVSGQAARAATTPSPHLGRSAMRPVTTFGLALVLTAALAAPGFAVVSSEQAEEANARNQAQPSSQTTTPTSRAKPGAFTQYTETIAGEPLSYPSSPNPIVSMNELAIPPGSVSEWMVHPVQSFLYVLEGTVTVEFAEDGTRQTFKAGQGFLQTRAHWHRGRNDGDVLARFVAIFIGAKGVPEMLHPPAGKLVDK